MPICRALERQVAPRAFSRAWANTGNKMPARIAIIDMTTRSSMRVNPRRLRTTIKRNTPSMNARLLGPLLPDVIDVDGAGPRRARASELQTDLLDGEHGVLGDHELQ